MAQLKMYCLPGTPINEVPLPEGYSVSRYQTEADKLAWCECCKNGLVGDDADESTFDDRITDDEDINIYEDVFFLDGDDSIAEESLARIAERIDAAPGADLYPCAVVAYEEDSDKKEIRDNFNASSPSEMTGVEALLEIDRLHGVDFCPMLQLTISRREFLMEHELKCVYGLRRQDSEFTPRALYLAKRVVPLHEPFYLYRLRANSVSSAAKGAGYFHKDWAIINKSLFAFHAQVSRESGFDRRVSACWARQWIGRFLYFWFSPKNMKGIPRERRLETLNLLFSEGFDDFDLLLKSAGAGKRLAGFWVRVFVCCSGLRGAAELFFRCYYRLSGMK